MAWSRDSYSVVPAHAGVIPARRLRLAGRLGCLRARGGDPGWHRYEVDVYLVVPAHAGVIPTPTMTWAR